MDKGISLTQLDLLREIGTIGMGRAATALADLLACKVEITLPETKVVPLESIDRILRIHEDKYFVLDIAIEGDMGGRLFFLIPFEKAKALGTDLLNQTLEEIDAEDPLFQSSLKEVVNIMTGAYMNVLSDMTGLTVIHGTPSLAIDMLSSLLNYFFVHIAQYTNEAIFIRSEIKVKDTYFGGTLIYFLDLDSMYKLFNSLGVRE